VTPLEAAQAQRRCDAATPGPWRAGSHDTGAYVMSGRYQEICELSHRTNARDDEDAELIAHARTDLPAALAALAEARRLTKDAFALAADALGAVKAALASAPGFGGPDDHAENSAMTMAWADYERMVDALKILKGAAG